jgi:hypothetical protein
MVTMLFLLRPPQTRLPIGLPRDPRGQAQWNALTLESYSSTRQVQAGASNAQDDPVASLRELAALHDSGALSDEEFSHAKARVLDQGDEAVS